eukprot:6463468-Amphidinium_carterae.1
MGPGVKHRQRNSSSTSRQPPTSTCVGKLPLSTMIVRHPHCIPYYLSSQGALVPAQLFSFLRRYPTSFALLCLEMHFAPKVWCTKAPRQFCKPDHMVAWLRGGAHLYRHCTFLQPLWPCGSK